MSYKIVIPTFQENKELNNCLECLNKFGKINKVLVINDNYPSEYLDLDNKQVEIENTGGDYWWSGSINVGFRRAIKDGDEFVIIMNSDNWMKNDLIEKLIQRYKRNKNVLHASTVVNQRGNVRCTGGLLKFCNYTVRMFNHGKHENELQKDVYYGNYNGGMGVLIPTEVIKKIGLMDERFQLSADREFFFRAYLYGVPVCAHEDIIIYTDDKHKAIDRSNFDVKNKIIRKITYPFNFRSPIYYKTVYNFYQKHTNKPLRYTFKALLNYYSV